MRNNRKKLTIKILICIILLGAALVSTQTLANNPSGIEASIKQEAYTEEYENWLKLSANEKANLLEPRKYDVQYENEYSKYLKGINNKIKVLELLKDSADDDKDLRTIIPLNVKIKNQEQTNMCWAFASTATLETHFAIKDYNNNLQEIEYDFSERHMAYSTAKDSLLNGEDYLYAFKGSISKGGNYFMAEQYLSTGRGAVLEAEMPFVNTEESIDIENIQIEDIQTTLLDTTLFATDIQTTRTELMTKMKSYITNYGGIYAGIHGASIFSANYNNATGALYCNNPTSTPMNHAVLIIGWDDEFGVENFGNVNYTTKYVPQNPGAWIIKNSWGECISEDLSTIKQSFYADDQNYFNELGYTSAEQIPNDFILDYYKQLYGAKKVTIDTENNTITVEVGDKGYMYVSYEDVNVYRYLWGIENAISGVDYDNIYIKDELGYSAVMKVTGGSDKPLYIANVFSRDIQKEEELTKISLFTTQEYNCKVYVNPNGNTLTAIEEVTLAKGNTNNTINIKPGYHTIEFAEPIKLTGSQFAVALEITNTFSEKKAAIEYRIQDDSFADATFAQGESFVSSDKTTWTDTKDLAKFGCDGNFTIKAFTNNIIAEPEPEPEILELQEIQITTPGKSTYYVGDNFDATGMVVKAIYSNSAKQEERDVSNAISIINGTNLQLAQTSVTISYTDGEITKTTTQAIVVQEEIIETPEETLEKIEVFELPAKSEYIKDVEQLELAGGIIKAIYSDETEEYIDMTNDAVTATGFDNTKLGTNTITISYNTKTTTFDVEIIEAPVVEEQPEEKIPELSDFEETKAVLTEIDMSTDSEGNYTMTIKVDGIDRKDEESNYKYYWYISGRLGENDIQAEKWTEINANKITKQSDGTYSLEIKIDSKNLSNMAELMNSDNLYLYIKEVATLGDNSKEQIISKSIEIDIKVEEDTSGKIEETLEKEEADDTIAEVEIPKAGINTKIILFIIAIAVIAVFAYNRFKYFNI